MGNFGVVVKEKNPKFGFLVPFSLSKRKSGFCCFVLGPKVKTWDFLPLVLVLKAPNLGFSEPFWCKKPQIWVFVGLISAQKGPKFFGSQMKGGKAKLGAFWGSVWVQKAGIWVWAQQNQGGFYGIEDKKREVWGFVIGSGSEKAELGSWFWA